MGKIGIWEIVVVLVVALIVFGPSKLPEIGKSIGKSINEFRRAASDIRKSIDITGGDLEEDDQGE
ncbi:MAG: twin-arginine translocase TatA/TatE family subunit [Firmicutes bacterium]|nr:twin-arginine translocase TatA/TatE family subunit [Bacillota bacterium]